MFDRDFNVWSTEQIDRRLHTWQALGTGKLSVSKTEKGIMSDRQTLKVSFFEGSRAGSSTRTLDRTAVLRFYQSHGVSTNVIPGHTKVQNQKKNIHRFNLVFRSG